MSNAKVGESNAPTSHTSGVPGEERWEDLSRKEQSQLSALEEPLVEIFRIHADATASGMRPSSPIKRPASPSPWLWSLSGIGAACALVWMVWWLWPGPWGQPPLRRLEHVAVTPLAKQPRQLKLSVPWDRQGKVEGSATWRLSLHRGTVLFVRQRQLKRVRLQLDRGQILVRVKPKSMERFQVSMRGDLQIVVVGTQFRAAQGQRWVRVEVLRGQVRIEHPTRPQRALKMGEGLRLWLDAEQRFAGKILRYRLPPAGFASPVRRILWESKQPSPQLFWFAMDRLESRHWPQEVRENAVESAINALLGRRQLGLAFQLLEAALAHPLFVSQREALLRRLATECHLHRVKTRRCQPYYLRYHQRYPKSPHRGLIFVFQLRGLSPAQKQLRRQLQQQARAFLKSAPRHGYGIKALRRLLQQ